MIELFSADTPNGKKIGIMLEEIGFEYKVTKVNINTGDQFKPEFRKISPFSKIPVIIDHENNGESILERQINSLLEYVDKENITIVVGYKKNIIKEKQVRLESLLKKEF